VDENVDAAEFGFRLLAERFDFGAVGKVGGEDLDAFAEVVRERFELLYARAVQADNGALGVEDAGNLLADAAGCAGNESLAAGKIKHGAVPLERGQPMSAARALSISAGVLMAIPVTDLSMRR